MTKQKIAVGTKIETSFGTWTVTEIRGDRVLVGCIGIEFSLARLSEGGTIEKPDAWVKLSS